MSLRISIGCLVLLVVISFTLAQDKSLPTANVVKKSSLLTDFQVIEFRRYTIRDGEREHFAQYFESYFPEAFQQLGAVAVGQMPGKLAAGEAISDRRNFSALRKRR
jgi:hypothetical protein